MERDEQLTQIFQVIKQFIGIEIGAYFKRADYFKPN